MSGLNYLLTEEIRAKEYDATWNVPNYALDNELLHHSILTVLLTRSRSFCKALFSVAGRLDRHSPAFDIWVKLDNGRTACIEVKIWHHWSLAQREKQIGIIKQLVDADGYIILLGNSSALSREKVQNISQGTFQKISYANLIRALDTVVGEGDLSEIAVSYKEGLRQQEQRIRLQYKDSDPNE